jgi:type IV secretory pathway component VirB8
MSPRQDPELHVDDEPEEERPLGTSEDEGPEPSGLAVDPYADDLLIGPRRGRRLPWLVIGVVVALVVVLVIAVVVLRARG